MVRRTIQAKVLRELYFLRRNMNVGEIGFNTGLKRKQVYEAIRHLENRGLIKKTKTIEKVGYKNPPTGKIMVEINETSKKRIKELIK